ncbi:MAG: protein kinase [Kofleriaceae bacterium]
MNARDVTTLPDNGDERDQPSRLGHFEIVGRLGSGGMGMVFEGRDTVLGRRVALKLLHPARTGSAIAPARLLREAQALAKLSHPNVVTVFEVGMAGEDPFVAMELVEGETLLAWMQKPRTWRDVLDLFIAVGHGLAAVHALQLVHRDFKPSNVLIDRNGVPKLGDFGLVTTIGEPVDAVDVASFPPTVAQTLTQSGSVLGTPAYMAPEQKLGIPVDPRADQYSFAKSLMEALPDGAPTALQPILTRALSEEPAARFPDMAALLDALARVRRGNRSRWIAAGSTAAVLGAVAIAWGFGRAQSAMETCARPTDKLASAWSPERRFVLAAHLAEIDPIRGAQRFGIAAGVLDRGGDRWLDQRVETCRAGRANQQSGELLDRRMSCLDRALVEIDDTAGVLERTTDRAGLDAVMKAIALPALDDCADTSALLELLPRPTDPASRAASDAVLKEVVELDVSMRTGVKAAVSRAGEIVDRARKLGDPETLARALRSLVTIQGELGDYDKLEVTAREAITQASAAHDDRLVTELWTTLLIMLGTEHKSDKIEEAHTLLPAAEAALARTKSSAELTARFLDAKSTVLAMTKDLPGALAALITAEQTLVAANATDSTSPLFGTLVTIKTRLATTNTMAGKLDDAIRAFREVIAIASQHYGDDHPAIMQMHFNLAITLRYKGDNETALAEFREAARIAEARLAPSPNLAEEIFAVGNTLVAMNRQAEAIPILVRAVDMERATLPAGDARLADALEPLSAAYVDTKRFDVAKPLLDETIALLEHDRRQGSTGTSADKLAVAYFNRAEWSVETSHCDDGWKDIDRALAIYRELNQPSDIYGTLILRADCQLDTKQWAGALATSEELFAAKDIEPDAHANAAFIHGEARYELGQKAQGIAEVRAAHDAMLKADAEAWQIDGAAKWLAAH